MSARNSNEQDPPRVLFVCCGNTCRSVLAEYLAAGMFGQAVRCESAGINPQAAQDADNAIYILQSTFGLDASGHRPRDVRSLGLDAYALIIALDKAAIPVIEGLGIPLDQIKFWNIRDPWGEDLTEYTRAATDIKRELVKLKRACDI